MTDFFAFQLTTILLVGPYRRQLLGLLLKFASGAQHRLSNAVQPSDFTTAYSHTAVNTASFAAQRDTSLA